MSSLRLYNPNAYIGLLVDDKTVETFMGCRGGIKTLADEITVEHFDKRMSNLNRSRWLKTSMRNLVEGDFLFIDGDTLVCDALDGIEQSDYELAAVLDQHTILPKSTHYVISQNLLKNLLNDSVFYNYEKYFNSGVLFVRDTSHNRQFFANWHDNWKTSVEQKINIDQPSLALTNYQLGFPIKELDGEWNCQIWHGASYFHSAKILHYFASEKCRYGVFDKELPLKLKHIGELDESDLKWLKQSKGSLPNPSFIAVGDDYEVFRSSLCGVLKFLYQYKFIFNIFEKLLLVPRIIRAKIRSKSKR
jgi:hypothetical protein